MTLELLPFVPFITAYVLLVRGGFYNAGNYQRVIFTMWGLALGFSTIAASLLAFVLQNETELIATESSESDRALTAGTAGALTTVHCAMVALFLFFLFGLRPYLAAALSALDIVSVIIRRHVFLLTLGRLFGWRAPRPLHRARTHA